MNLGWAKEQLLVLLQGMVHHPDPAETADTLQATVQGIVAIPLQVEHGFDENQNFSNTPTQSKGHVEVSHTESLQAFSS